DEARALRVERARALFNAGRCGAAGTVYLEAAEGADAALRRELRGRAAEAFLYGGQVEDGLAVAGARGRYLVPALAAPRARGRRRARALPPPARRRAPAHRARTVGRRGVPRRPVLVDRQGPGQRRADGGHVLHDPVARPLAPHRRSAADRPWARLPR